MSTARHDRGGAFATARKGGIDTAELAFIAEKRERGVSDFSIAHMIGRPLTSVQAVPRDLRGYSPAPVVVAKAPLPPKPKPSPQGPSSKHRSGMPSRVRLALEAHAAFHGVSFADLIGPSAKRCVAHPRQEAFHILRFNFRKPNGEPSYSLPQIGSWFDRDHTTVMKGIEAHVRRKAGFTGEWRASARAAA